MASIIHLSRSLHCARAARFPSTSLGKLCSQFTLQTRTHACDTSIRQACLTASKKSPVCHIANSLSISGKRFYAKKGKLPFEVDIKVPKDTILYTHSNSKFFKMLSIFGVAQLVFWGQLALVSYTSLGIIDTNEAEAKFDKNTFWGKVLVMQTEYKSRIALLCVTIGSLVTFFTFIYPRRTIRQLILLQGGRDLRVVTYSHFATSRSFTAPVNHLSVEAPRAGETSQVSLKLKGHRFFYLMDKRDGKFHDTNLFDYAVGLRRNIK